MLAKRITRERLNTIGDRAAVISMYDMFLKDKNKEYIVVVDQNDRPKGIVYRGDIEKVEKSDRIMDYVTKDLITLPENSSISEIDQAMISIAKNNINEIAMINSEGKLTGVWEKDRPDVSDFYSKFTFIKQAGYSITDWIYHYYGQNVVIGIHSYIEYTDVLLKEIENSTVQVRFICQSGGNARGFRGEILEKSFSNITDEDLQKCDLIINTFMYLKGQVQYLYSHYKKYDKVVSLYDIVSELYHYERDAGYMFRVANMIAASGRKVYIFDYPSIFYQNDHSKREHDLIQKNFNVNKLRTLVQNDNAEEQNDAEDLIMPALNKARKKNGSDTVSFKEFKKYFPSMSEESNAHIRYVGNYVTIYDINSPHVNIKNGTRVTVSPSKDLGQTTKIHFFGKSWVFGYNCSDEYTIPSFVQRISNENGLGYVVCNHGTPGLREDMIANCMYVQDTQLPKEDIFVLVHMFKDYGNRYNKKVADEQDYVNKLSSDRPHDYGEIWVDTGHIGEDGSELLAHQIVDALTGKGKLVPGVFKNKFNPYAGRKIYKYDVKGQASVWADMPEFKDYCNYIHSYKQKIGSIVMNCNPFTLGHRYLIETAAARCDKLYIFVVEEDKSVFPFEDRIQLVRGG